MTQEQQDRVHLLENILKYTVIKTALLTTGEKILINQERAYLLNQQNPKELQTIREYKVPESIEKKIKNIVKLISQ